MKVIFVHEHPPLPTTSHDWRAYFDGCEEDGRDGFGETKLKAALDLWGQITSSEVQVEEMIACLVAVLQADLDDMMRTHANGHLSPHFASTACVAYERAISLIEGIA